MGDMVRRLVCVQGPGGAGGRREVSLREGRLSIGRGLGNGLVLDDREVSKAHAEIVVTSAEVLLRDLGSANGTLVNDQRIEEHRLVPGDEITLGRTRFVFESTDGAAQGPRVALLPASPIDHTQVLATSSVDVGQLGTQLRDVQVVRARYERIRAAFEAVQQLLATTDIQLLCQRIIDVAFRLLNVESGAVLLFDDKGQLVPWATRSGTGSSGIEIAISRTIVDQVVREQAAVLATDALRDARWSASSSIALSGMRSIMCVPLLSGGRTYGLLHVGNATQAAAFSNADLDLVSGIGAGAGVALSNAFMTHQLAEEARARESLGRFLSPVLVEQVLHNAVSLSRGGVEREVTVMFADIRGFTALTERSRATDVVRLLNEYFDQMVEVVFRHEGVLDKFIGDALMAVWGTLGAGQNDAAKAGAAAREMQDTVASLNALRRDQGQEPLGIGIGLASGQVVAGAMGARRRMEYTVIGDAVNLASRLAGMAKAGEILCDEETYRRSGRPSDAKPLPAAQVKGKTQLVPVFRLR